MSDDVPLGKLTPEEYLFRTAALVMPTWMRTSFHDCEPVIVPATVAMLAQTRDCDRRVADTWIDDIHISTIAIEFRCDQQTHAYETMIFGLPFEYQRRVDTLLEAHERHRLLVEHIQGNRYNSRRLKKWLQRLNAYTERTLTHGASWTRNHSRTILKLMMRVETEYPLAFPSTLMLMVRIAHSDVATVESR